MVKDLNYREEAYNQHIALTTVDETPEILKRAITLMLFSKDPEIRNFNGDSVVAAFPTIPQSGFEGINFYLTLAAKRIQDILSTMYSNIESVYFETDEQAPQLTVMLNVKLKEEDEPLAQAIFTV